MFAPEMIETVGFMQCHTCGAELRERDKFCRRCGVFEIEVTIPNPRQTLKSGMIASLEVAAAAPAPPVTVVPVSAVMRVRNQSDQYAVFVVEEKGGRTVARSRIVKLGEALGNTIAVLEGVSAGERVITAGASLALDGQAVQVIP